MLPGGDSSGMQRGNAASSAAAAAIDADMVDSAESGGPSTSSSTPAVDEGNQRQQPSSTYIGLVNQASTCYLNSVLQTLFMTPEFRNSLYRYEFDGSQAEGERSMPYQLQRLFLGLETTSKSALETTALTRSFGWDRSESYQQHDVQELCRLMFEALDKIFRRAARKKAESDASPIHLTPSPSTVGLVGVVGGSHNDQTDFNTAAAATTAAINLPTTVSSSEHNSGDVSSSSKSSPFVIANDSSGGGLYGNRLTVDAAVPNHPPAAPRNNPSTLSAETGKNESSGSGGGGDNNNDKSVIESLYRGTMLDYVKCLCCQNESSRDVHFNDLPLAVRPFGSTKAHASLEEALAAFVKPELLDGSNQYSCDTCQKKCDAHKGFKISDFPYLLQIQLKRFDYDYTTLSRIKLNDKVKNHLIEAEIDEDRVKQYLSEGPFVYELFSIMVHSGSATGGHYLAYIKNLDNKQWFCFDDSDVRKATMTAIHQTYGGGAGYYVGGNTNAYMLIYRQVNSNRNETFRGTENLQPHLERLLTLMEAEEEAERIEKERKESRCQVALFFRELNSADFHCERVDVAKATLVRDLLPIAYRTLSESLPQVVAKISVENTRLIKIETFSQSYGSSLEAEEDKSMIEAFPWSRNFLLEWKYPGMTFRPYENNGITMHVRRVHLVTSRISDEREYIWVSFTTKISQIQQLIYEQYAASGLNVIETVEEVRIVCTKDNERTIRYLDDGDKTIGDEVGLSFRAVNLFVDVEDNPASTTDRSGPFEDSLFRKAIEHQLNAQTIVLQYPTPKEYDNAGYNVPSTEDLLLQISEMEGREISVERGAETEDSNNASATANSGQGRSQNIISDTRNNPEDEGEEDNSMDCSSGTNRKIDPCSFMVKLKKIDVPEAATQPIKTEVDVDRRMRVCELKTALAPHLALSPNQFSLAKQFGHVNFDISDETQTLASCSGIQALQIKLSRPLETGEEKIVILRFDMDKPQEEWQKLFEIIGARSTTIEAIAAECSLYLQRCFKEIVPPSRLKIREKRGQCVPVLTRQSTLADRSTGNYFSSPLVVQILSQEETIYEEEHHQQQQDQTAASNSNDNDGTSEAEMCHVFVRRWSQRDLVVGRVEEIIVPKQDMFQAIQQRINRMHHIPVENVELSKPGQSMNYPYSIERIDLLEKTSFFSAFDPNYYPPWLNGHLVYFRDSREQTAELTAETKKEMSIRDSAERRRTFHSYQQRKERALRIRTERSTSIADDEEILLPIESQPQKNSTNCLIDDGVLD